MENLAVRKNIPLKALDELVHPDAGLASVFLGHCERFDMGIELTPLSSPIGADLFFDSLPPSGFYRFLLRVLGLRSHNTAARASG